MNAERGLCGHLTEGGRVLYSFCQVEGIITSIFKSVYSNTSHVHIYIPLSSYFSGRLKIRL